MNLARMYVVAGVTGLLCYTFYNSVPHNALTSTLNNIMPFAFTAMTFLGIGALATGRK